MIFPRALALTLLLASAAAPAQAEQLVLSISRHQVLVNSSFTGTSIVLFGTVEPDDPTERQRLRDYDLIVTVTGPRQTIVTRHKERVAGIWTNVNARTFIDVPSYLAIFANKPFASIADSQMRRRLQIGFDYTLLRQRVGPDFADTVPGDPFRTNFVRLKQQQEMYFQEDNGVTFLTPTVFRAGIPVPASSPIGGYEVDVKLFSGGAPLTRSTTAFEVVKVGFEQFLATGARDYGLLYGLATALMALMTGWIASVVFRRD